MHNVSEWANVWVCVFGMIVRRRNIEINSPNFRCRFSQDAISI